MAFEPFNVCCVAAGPVRHPGVQHCDRDGDDDAQRTDVGRRQNDNNKGQLRAGRADVGLAAQA